MPPSYLFGPDVEVSLPTGPPQQSVLIPRWPPPGELRNPGTEPTPPALQVNSLPSKPPREAQEYWSW